MSIFSSIGKAISSAAKSAYNWVSGVASSVSSNLQKSNPNNYTASVANAGLNPNKTVYYDNSGNKYQKTTINAVQVPSSVGPVGSASYNAFVSGNPQGNSITSTTYSNNYVPQLPTTISAGKQSVNSAINTSPTLDLTGFNPATYTISAKSLGANSGEIAGSGNGVGIQNTPISLDNKPSVASVSSLDTTKLAGGYKDLYSYNQKTGQYDVVKDNQTQTLNDKVKERMDFYDKYVGIKADALDSPDVIQARNERLRLQRELQAPTNELNAVIAKQNQDLLQLRQTGSQEGVTEAVYGGQQNAINYNAAIRALPLQARIAQIQGDLRLAQDYETELTNTKQRQIDRQYEYNLSKFKAIEGLITKEEERSYQEIKTANEKAYKQEQDLIQTQGKLITSAYENNAPQSVINAIRNARTAIEAVNVAGQYGGDMLGQVIRQRQADKVQSEIDANKPVTGEYASVINGAAGLVPSTKKTQVKQNIANAISSGNYVNAYAEIANAVSDGITGTNKTKFDDARTDMGILNGMRTAIQDYASAGGDMGLLKGTEEQIKRKLGIDSGKASTLATQLWREFQTYRSNMTGAAFTPQESRDYASVNPTLGKSLDLNLSVIDGALNQLENRVVSTVNARVPDAKKIYDLAKNNNANNAQYIDYTATLDLIFQ